jgi:hypothetical protein
MIRRRLSSVRRRAFDRRGAVSVEFAVVAPVFVIIVLGIYQTSVMYQTQNLLTLAAREGARFGAMDRQGMLEPGQTSNQKLESDVLSFLESSGIPTDDVGVFVEAPFDLDDPENDLELFEVRVELPYDLGLQHSDNDEETDFKLIGKVIFRNSRAAIVD